MNIAPRVAFALLLGTGCGDVVAVAPDATDVDAELPDAAPDAPTEGAITVRVFTLSSDGELQPDATVAVLALDGSTIALGLPDANGMFTATIPVEGANVHVARPGAGQIPPVLSTVLGVKPGEQLQFGVAPGSRTNGPIMGEMTATLQPIGLGSQYEVHTACDSSSTNLMPPRVTLGFRDDCHGDRFPALAIARDSAGGVSMVYRGDFLYAPGTTIAMPPFEAPAQTVVTLTNQPPLLTELKVERATVVGGRAVAREYLDFNGTQPEPLVVTLLRAPVAAVGADLALTMYRADSGTQQQLTVRTLLSGTMLDVDLAALPVPVLGASAVTGEGFTWTAVESSAAGDTLATVSNAVWTDGAGTSGRVAWRVVGPWSPTGRVHPPLPPEFAAFDISLHRSDANFAIIGLIQSVDLDRTDEVAFRARADQYLAGSDAVAVAVGAMPFGIRIATTSPTGVTPP